MVRAAGQRGDFKFAQIEMPNVPRSAFNRSHTLKTTFDAGFLVPIYLDEVLPGDTHTVEVNSFVRMATPLYPVMDGMYLETFFFFVPYRLLWENWSKFLGEQEDPGDSTDYTIPLCTTPTGGWGEKSLGDYFGLPIDVERDVCVFPFRAFNLIFNEWFRDQNLSISQDVLVTDGPDAASRFKFYNSGAADDLPRRGKRHDYFTSCLPWPQKGTAVELPLGTSAPLTLGGAPEFTVGAATGVVLEAGSTGDPHQTFGDRSGGSNPSIGNQYVWEDPKLTVDLSSATAATINQLRQAFQLQKLYERDARGGTRLREIIKAHFGVTVPDYRVQVPEYLGGTKQGINVNPVAYTATGTSDAVGELGGFAMSAHSANGFTKSFTEHGLIMGIANVRADLTYQQGIHRMWTRQTKVDFYWPALSHIGEQAVLSQEIYADGSGVEASGTGDWSVFGYQERYAEYKYKNSQITGNLRSTASSPLDAWHLGQEFASRPTLNDAFIEDTPPLDRVISVNAAVDADHFIADFFFKVNSVRPMPVYSTPGLIDHF